MYVLSRYIYIQRYTYGKLYLHLPNNYKYLQ